MNILYISQIFPPEPGAPAARAYEISKAWAKNGHCVTVITGFPNHPLGIIPPEYRGKIFQEENIDGMRLLRNWIYATPNIGFFKRILNHLSFMVSSIIFSLSRSGKQDVIIVTSPPFFSVIAGYIFSRFKKTPFIFEIRDLWPGVFEELGIIRDRFILRIITFIEEYLYKRADRIIVVTRSFKEILINRKINPNKIFFIPNGVNINIIKPEDKNNFVREKYNLHDKFVLSYIGTHGVSQGLATVVKAANELRDNQKILFLLVGEGAEKKDLIALARKFRLNNILFLPKQPRELIPKFYAASDVCIVSLKNIDLFKAFVPLKMFEMMAAGRPIIGCVKGEAEKILFFSKGAMVCAPENEKQLSETVMRMYNDKELCKQLGQKARLFAETNYDIKKIAKKYENILKESLKQKG